MKIWEECYNHYGYSARNYSNTDCFNCPHKDEKNTDCETKRANWQSECDYAEWQKEWTNWNAN